MLFTNISVEFGIRFDDVKLSKDKQYTKPKKTKTKRFILPEKESTFSSNDMRITEAGHQKATFASADGTPKAGTTDKDGIEWYGEGVTIE